MAATDPGATKKARPLTPKQWAEAEAMWESGDSTYEDLTSKFGKARSTLERHFKAHGIVKGAKAAAKKKRVEEELAKKSIDDALVHAARIRETRENHYKMANVIGGLIFQEVLGAKNGGRPMATMLNNIKALKESASALAIIRTEKWTVLGLDRPDAIDPDELPELVVTELTDEQISELRDRDHLDEGDLQAGSTVAVRPEDHQLGDDDVLEEGDD